MHSYTKSELNDFSHENLVSEVLQLQDEIDALEVRVYKLEDEIIEKEYDIDELRYTNEELEAAANDVVSTTATMVETFEKEIKRVGYVRFSQDLAEAMKIIANYYPE